MEGGQCGYIIYHTEIIMKKNKRKIDKFIAGSLAVIAISVMGIMVILLMNHFNVSNAMDDDIQAVNKINAAEENVPLENSSSQKDTSATNSPYYQYKGNLSDKPIIPTEIENVEILDHLDDEEAIQLYKDEIMNYVIDYAKEYPVYGNPTIIPGCEPATYEDTVIVDIHAADNRLISFSLSKDRSKFADNEIHFQITDTHTPYIIDGVYLINSYSLYCYLISDVGLDSETAIKKESELLQLVIDEYKSLGITGELLQEIPYIFIDDIYTQENQDGKVVAYIIDVSSTIKSINARPTVYIVKQLGEEDYTVVDSQILDYSVGTREESQ